MDVDACGRCRVDEESNGRCRLDREGGKGVCTASSMASMLGSRLLRLFLRVLAPKSPKCSPALQGKQLCLANLLKGERALCILRADNLFML